MQLNDQSKPSGLIWVQFDYEDVKGPDRKTEIFMLEVLKVHGHQLNQLQHNLLLGGLNQLNL